MMIRKVFIAVALAIGFFISLAANAEAHPSTGIVVDRQGRVYFADERRSIVWKIETDGTLTPFVKGKHSHAIFLDSDGNLYGEHHEYIPNGEKWEVSIWKMTPAGQLTDVLPPTTSPTPGWGVIVDSEGNRYSGDWFGGDRKGPEAQIVKRTSAGAVIILAGRGKQGSNSLKLGEVRGLTLSSDGSLYFTEGGAVRKMATNGAITTLASGIKIQNPADDPLGSGTKEYLAGLAIDANGNAYVADYANRRVIKITPKNEITTVIKCEAPWAPTGVALMDGNVYVLEHGLKMPKTHRGPRVRKVSTDGTVTKLAVVKK